MQRARTKSTSSVKQEILLIGEQLRFVMHTQDLIGDRKYHLRSYKSCFVGQETVTWLMKTGHVNTREAAVTAMMMLQEHYLLHHVCDDHLFKDEKLFYRFRRDDDSYGDDRDLQAFYTGLNIFNKITKCKDMMRDYSESGNVFRDAFNGSSFVDWMIVNEEACSRAESVRKGRELLEREIIKHVTDDYHFRDGNYKYQFCFDFNQPYLLSDIFRLKRNGVKSYSNSSASHTPLNHNRDRHKSGSVSSYGSYPPLTRVHQNPSPVSDSSHLNSNPVDAPHRDSFNSIQSNSSSENNSEDVDRLEPKSVLVRQMSVNELEEPNSPFLKKIIKIMSDSVGYGFVIRGDGPTYVQTVDPMGPAASAGIKVRQYIYSVNGAKVLNMDHTTVGRLIKQQDTDITLVVLSHFKDIR